MVNPQFAALRQQQGAAAVAVSGQQPTQLDAVGVICKYNGYRKRFYPNIARAARLNIACYPGESMWQK